MNAVELAILNLEETRRRSIKVWSGIPEEFLHWKPDNEAMTCLEMVRHVLESEHYYHLAIKNRGDVPDYESPFSKVPLQSVEEELVFAAPFRKEFLETIASFNDDDFSSIMIDRSQAGYIRRLGDFLMRIAYHDSIHTGQLLDYMRTAGVKRPDIWD